MSRIHSSIAFIFPGQGAQYPGMAQDFVASFSQARLVFEEADDLLQYSISKTILKGPSDLLTQTKNSQLAIYITSIAILRVVEKLYSIKPAICAGLSLGEYTALTAGGWLSFSSALPLIKKRADFMEEACQKYPGAMAAVIGLEAAKVQEVIKEVNCPNDLWIANFNCPGQVVLSGTVKGIEKGAIKAKEKGAKRVLPLQVSGAFHSGLMQSAESKLTPFIEQADLQIGSSQIVMNVSGKITKEKQEIKNNLIKQVTHSVCWEQSISTMNQQGVVLFIEFGPGKTLSAFNKRMSIQAPTLSIEKIEDLEILANFLNKS